MNLARADSLALEPAVGELRFEKPVALIPAPSGKAWYVVEQAGVVSRAEPSASGVYRIIGN